jgi:prevent-host-death family protein
MLATATEMKNNFGQYLMHVMDENSEVIITKNSRKVARLVPYAKDIERYYTIKDNAPEYEYDKCPVSYEEFIGIYEKSQTRMEFINGEIFVMSSPDISHQETLGNLYIIFRQYFKGKICKPYLAPFDVHFRKKDIHDPDVMQPDLTVICDMDNNINEKNKYMGTPSLALEILSVSTRSKDMVYKLNTYMMSGVEEYWIVDPISKCIIIYTFKDNAIDQNMHYRLGETAISLIYEGLEVNTTDLFADIF